MIDHHHFIHFAPALSRLSAVTLVLGLAANFAPELYADPSDAPSIVTGHNPTGSNHSFEIDLKKPGAPIQTTMYGIFFEDINYAADGGLYAELVKNRSFEFDCNPLQGWSAFGSVEVRDDGPFVRNPHYVRLMDPGHPHRWTGLDNEGFLGIGFKEGEDYRFSVWARVPDGGTQRIRIEFVDPSSQNGSQYFTQAHLDISGAEWARYEVVMKSGMTLKKGVLRIFLESRGGSLDLEHVSLFPVDTWKGRPGGLRRDLAEALYDLHPGVFRFPGGCIVEGTDLENRYYWKDTVGPVENRPFNKNRWQYTFTGRFYPDYYQSYGLGFYEYFLLSEDLGSEPLPILNCGLACQYQNKPGEQTVPVCELQEYIQDALDLIEFANGGTDTKWGALRAEMGHPAPFGLKFLGIGNEQWGEVYPEHLKPFIEVIGKAYPEIKIVGSSGPGPGGEQFDYLWPQMKALGADLVDEHYYRPYSWFRSQAARYDNYDRKGPKVFAGEYACHDRGSVNHFYAAIHEAAFMTGLERNADIVHMATYAPLFAHEEGWQWHPDLIWFDNLDCWRTCSWHVQELYGEFRGKNVAKLTMDGAAVTGAEGQDGLYASAVTDGSRIYVKVANLSEQPQTVEFRFNASKKSVVNAVERILFAAESPEAIYGDNSSAAPDAYAPVRGAFCESSDIVAPASFAVYVFEIK